MMLARVALQVMGADKVPQLRANKAHMHARIHSAHYSCRSQSESDRPAFPAVSGGLALHSRANPVAACRLVGIVSGMLLDVHGPIGRVSMSVMPMVVVKI
jgi:hypothetical protein